MKKHNFSAGPSILSEFTIKNTAEGILDLNNGGLSVMEISHRSPEFQAIMDEAVQLFKELLNVPDTHEVLFLQGGANLQFSMIPFNLLKSKAGYLVTGSWASKAYKEAAILGEAVEVASSKDKNYSYLPKGYQIPSDLDYFHITTNNTIYGTEIKEDIDSPVPLVADASSDIFSRPMDVSKYGLIYGGAQKNLGPAGLAFVIVQKNLLGKTGRAIPTYLDYQVHIDKGSMYNTPPCVAIFASLQTLKWYKQLGGIDEMHKVNLKKATLLYDEIDRNSLFKCTVPDANDRSIMNVTFVMTEGKEEKEKDFLELAKSKGIVGIKGHRSVGGFRASIYNAMPVESIQVLIDAMKEFEKNA